MASRTRSYRDDRGRELLLRSERTVSLEAGSWTLKLELLRRSALGRRRIAHKTVVKSGAWETSAIRFVLAQEEAEFLQANGIAVSMLDLLEGP